MNLYQFSKSYELFEEAKKYVPNGIYGPRSPNFVTFGSYPVFISHGGDIHKDHQITFEATLVAARPVNKCPVKSIYSYETLSETEWSPPFTTNAFIPTFFVDVTEFLENKIAAFNFFKTQVKEFPHPRSVEAIQNLANLRGSAIGVERAEAFMVIRQIMS